MEMHMPAGKKPQKQEVKSNLRTPEAVQNRQDVTQAVDKNRRYPLAPVSKAFVAQFPDTEYGVRSFCCSRCHFVSLSIVPYVSGKIDTMALEYRCLERSNEFLGHLFVHEDGIAWLPADSNIPEFCGILSDFEHKITAAASAVDARAEINAAIKALWGGENQQFALSSKQLLAHLQGFADRGDYDGLFAYEKAFNAFAEKVKKGGILKESLELDYEPARNFTVLNTAHENFLALRGENAEVFFKEFFVTRAVLQHLWRMRNIIYDYAKPYHEWFLSPEWSRGATPPELFSGSKEPREEKPYIYTPADLDEDERAEGFVTFDELYPAIVPRPTLKGRWETA